MASAFQPDPNRPSQILRYVTAPIQTAEQLDGPWTASGTGFLFAFVKGDERAVLLVTNKHVLEGAARIGITFHVADNNGGPQPGAGREIAFVPSNVPIIPHPDPDIDLIAIAVAPLVRHVQQQEGWGPFIWAIGPEVIPKDWEVLGPLEDIIMPGYPNGLADDFNNFPIIRRGITATHCGSAYQGKAEFLADIAVFPGSSGSPILIVNEGSFSTPDGLYMGTRLMLLGILHGGHYMTQTGEVMSAPAPTTSESIAEVDQMIHLGACVSARQLLELESLLPGW